MINNFREQARLNIEKLKNEGKKIFYVEGVFDLLHEGHIAFLSYLRNKICSIYGKNFVIVAAVESNKKTQKKKGKNRPIEDEFIRLENIKNTGLVDIVYINDNDVRNLKEELKEFNIDYLIFPEEYIKNLKLFLIIKKKFKKRGIKILLSRHKQYEKYGVSQNLSLIHTTYILESGIFGKIVTKLKHITYLTKETLFLLLKD